MKLVFITALLALGTINLRVTVKPAEKKVKVKPVIVKKLEPIQREEQKFPSLPEIPSNDNLDAFLAAEKQYRADFEASVNFCL